jgi:hypothetical protein
MSATDGQQSTAAKWIAGAVVAVLLTAIVALERFDAARDTVATIRKAAGDAAADAAGSSLVFWWLLATVVGVSLACLLAALLIQATPDADKRNRVKWIVWPTIALWAIWALWGAFTDGTGGFRAGIHYVTIGLFVVVLLLAAPPVLGEVGSAWKRTSAVRMLIVLLLVVYALFFVVPLTADQTAEVLRAWGDSSLTRVVAGFAGALLLGVAVRASARRLLALGPTAAQPSSPDGARWAVVGGLAGVSIGAFFLGWKAACAALALAAIAVLASWPNGRTLDIDTDAADRVVRSQLDDASLRVADSLGLVPLLMLTSGLVVATVDSWLVSAGGTRGRLTGITFVALVLFAVLAAHVYRPSNAERKLHGAARVVIAAAASFAAGMLMGGGDHWFTSPVGAVAACLLVAWSLVLALRLLGYDSPLTFATVGGTAGGTALSVFLLPVTAPRAIGTLGCALILAAGIVLLLHAPAAWAARHSLHSPGFKPWPQYVPLVTMLVVWIAVAFSAAPKTAHQVRTVDQPAGGVQPKSLDWAVGQWLKRANAAPHGPSVPMLLVGASGGGTKAAYWTALVLDCVVGGVPPDPNGDGDDASECGSPDEKGPKRLSHVFVTSSVSGGSIGVLDFLAHLTHGDALGDPWLDRKVGREVLSPLTAWGLVHDMPALLVGLETDPNKCVTHDLCWARADRALVQEAAIGDLGDSLRGNPGEGILSVPTHEIVPVFNGSISGASGRILISPLDLAPVYTSAEPCRAPHEDGQAATGALDAAEVLGDKDVPLVSAALLSARFPVLEPAARVGREAGKDENVPCPKPGATLPAVRVRDGGYVENTGLLTIADLLPAIRRAIEERHPAFRVPIIVLSIDDDPEAQPPKPNLREPRLGPVSVLTRAGTGYITRKARDTISSCQVTDVAYLRVSPAPHVGAHAATGWEISETGRRHDLGQALAQGTDGSHQITKLRGWLDGTRVPSC